MAAARAWYAIHLERCVDRLMAALAPWQAADASAAFVRARLHGAVRGIVTSMAQPMSTHLIEIDIGRTLAEIYPPSIETLHAVRDELIDALITDLPPAMLPLIRIRIGRTLADIVWGMARVAMVPRTVAIGDPVAPPSATRQTGTGSEGTTDPPLSAEWVRTFVAHYPVAITAYDLDSGMFVAASRHVERVLGYTADRLETLTDEELISPDSPDDDYDKGIDLLAGRIDLFERVGRFFHQDGHVVTLDLRFWVMGEPGTSPRYMFTEMRPKAPDEAEWVEADRRYRHLAQLAHDTLVIVDPAGSIRYANPAIERALGIPPEQATGTSLLEYAVDGDRQIIEDLLGRLRDSPPRATDQAEVRLNRRDGLWRWFEVTGTNLQDVAGLNGISIQAREISAHKELAAVLEEQALLDPLTGIRNRRGIHRRLDQDIARFAATGESTAVMYVDLDGFKAINDRFGHTIGDRFLTETGQRLSGVLDPDSLAGRVGGDEFVVISPADSLDRALEVAERVIGAVSVPFVHDGQSLAIGCSLGLIILERPGHTVASVLAAADAALYRAKARRDGHPEIGRDQPDSDSATDDRVSGLP